MVERVEGRRYGSCSFDRRLNFAFGPVRATVHKSEFLGYQ